MGNSFEELASRHQLHPIPNCPGRWIITDLPEDVSIVDWLGPDVAVKVFKTDKARDLVQVVRLSGGGIITYCRKDGTYLHTLNHNDGFERKFRQLDLSCAAD